MPTVAGEFSPLSPSGYIPGYIVRQSTGIPAETPAGLFRNIEDSQQLTGLREIPICMGFKGCRFKSGRPGRV